MKRILITGGNGLLGQKVVELFSRSTTYNLLLTSKQEQSAFTDETVSYKQLDVSDRQEVRKVIDEIEPDVIVHTAAMTNVDKCETERNAAWRANVTAVENIAHSAKLTGARVVHISTDYVFDGKNGPYDEFARPNPVSYYGRTKLASENILNTVGIPHTIFRTMVLYGIGYGVKMNFALWVLRELSEGRTARVVDDQIGNPTLADDLAYAIVKSIELERTGLYHVAGRDLVSRYAFARTLAEVFEFDPAMIVPIKTSSLKQSAPRPMKSGFITLKAETDLGIKLSDMRQGLTVLRNQLSVNMKDFTDK